MHYDYTDLALENSTSCFTGSHCDLSYVLRKMLIRGIKEAEYRVFKSHPDEVSFYKCILIELESFLYSFEDETLESLLYEREGREKMINYTKICHWLVSLDTADVSADYDDIIAALGNGPKKD